MSTLVLRLGGPMQAWGTSSRFSRRGTDRAPSKSGVLGLLAAAQGRRRVDPLEDLLALSMAVRVDQPGRVERDFHTTRTRDGRDSMPLSDRLYLTDALFVVALQGDDGLVEGLAGALRRPAHPLSLGRRSCPPTLPVVHGVVDLDRSDALASVPWLAGIWVRRRHRGPSVQLETVSDCAPGEPGSDLVRDQPISFDPRRREYGWRSVQHGQVTIPTGAPEVAATVDAHDPFAVVDEAEHDPFAEEGAP